MSVDKQGDVGKSDSEFTLRRLTVGDAAACAEIEAVLFDGDDPWPVQAFVAELSQRYNYYVGAFTAVADDSGSSREANDSNESRPSGEVLAAYADVTRLGTPGAFEYEIHTIGVAPRFQRRGLGRQLMDALIAVVSEDPGPIFLEVRTDNEPAIALYREYGFDVAGLRKNYYPESGADAFTMVRSWPE